MLPSDTPAAAESCAVAPGERLRALCGSCGLQTVLREHGREEEAMLPPVASLLHLADEAQEMVVVARGTDVEAAATTERKAAIYREASSVSAAIAT